MHLLQRLCEEHSLKLRQLMLELGDTLLASRRLQLPPTKSDRDRIARIEAYQDLIGTKTRELEAWKQYLERANNLGMLTQVHFRQRMVRGMDGQLAAYRQELNQLRLIPTSFWTEST